MTGFEGTSFTFFRRKLKFLLYKLSETNFIPVANITIPELRNLTSNLDATLIKQTNFRIGNSDNTGIFISLFFKSKNLKGFKTVTFSSFIGHTQQLELPYIILIVVIVLLIFVGIFFLIYLRVRYLYPLTE
jgi:hypothetical protein